MPHSLTVLGAGFLFLASAAAAADLTAVVDNTSYNAGSTVRLRVTPAAPAKASIRYAGTEKAVVTSVALPSTTNYGNLWTIPWDAQPGRYEVDITPVSGAPVRNATSFAVYRQFAKVLIAELDKTFYTSGDQPRAHIIVQNLSDKPLRHLRVEFERYTYPWIARAPDDPPLNIRVVANDLSLQPHATREFDVANVIKLEAKDKPIVDYYSVVIRDSQKSDHIYDLAFTTPVFTRPPNTYAPKQYPFSYLYGRLADVPKSQAYRHFYPPEFVSDAIVFDTRHTMFATGSKPTLSFEVKNPPDITWPNSKLRARVLDAKGREVAKHDVSGAVTGNHTVTLDVLPEGRYTLEADVVDSARGTLARNRLEFAINKLPKSILVFCAHQDDDTDHPATIRAAVENNIPIHFVYFTAGDAGGCDRYYMHSCDAPRAMDFAETRIEEARASLASLGVPRENVFFLGLPDGGLEQIWKYHIKPSDPYLSVLLATNHSPYREAAIPNLPYSREPVVEAAKAFIERYQPELIITGHPDERHVDHRTNPWIVIKAMQELLREKKLSPGTQITTDIAYGPGPQKHAPYKYQKEILYVPGEVARMAQEALWYYESQEGNGQQAHIVDYDKLSREEVHYRILDWQAHEGWNE